MDGWKAQYDEARQQQERTTALHQIYSLLSQCDKTMAPDEQRQLCQLTERTLWQKAKSLEDYKKKIQSKFNKISEAAKTAAAAQIPPSPVTPPIQVSQAVRPPPPQQQQQARYINAAPAPHAQGYAQPRPQHPQAVVGGYPPASYPPPASQQQQQQQHPYPPQQHVGQAPPISVTTYNTAATTASIYQHPPPPQQPQEPHQNGGYVYTTQQQQVAYAQQQQQPMKRKLEQVGVGSPIMIQQPQHQQQAYPPPYHQQHQQQAAAPSPMGYLPPQQQQQQMHPDYKRVKIEGQAPRPVGGGGNTGVFQSQTLGGNTTPSTSSQQPQQQRGIGERGEGGMVTKATLLQPHVELFKFFIAHVDEPVPEYSHPQMVDSIRRWKNFVQKSLASASSQEVVSPDRIGMLAEGINRGLKYCTDWRMAYLAHKRNQMQQQQQAAPPPHYQQQQQQQQRQAVPFQAPSSPVGGGGREVVDVSNSPQRPQLARAENDLENELGVLEGTMSYIAVPDEEEVGPNPTWPLSGQQPIYNWEGLRANIEKVIKENRETKKLNVLKNAPKAFAAGLEERRLPMEILTEPSSGTLINRLRITFNAAMGHLAGVKPCSAAFSSAQPTKDGEGEGEEGGGGVAAVAAGGGGAKREGEGEEEGLGIGQELLEALECFKRADLLLQELKAQYLNEEGAAAAAATAALRGANAGSILERDQAARVDPKAVERVLSHFRRGERTPDPPVASEDASWTEHLPMPKEGVLKDTQTLIHLLKSCDRFKDEGYQFTYLRPNALKVNYKGGMWTADILFAAKRGRKKKTNGEGGGGGAAAAGDGDGGGLYPFFVRVVVEGNPASAWSKKMEEEAKAALLRWRQATDNHPVRTVAGLLDELKARICLGTCDLTGQALKLDISTMQLLTPYALSGGGALGSGLAFPLHFSRLPSRSALPSTSGEGGGGVKGKTDDAAAARGGEGGAKEMTDEAGGSDSGGGAGASASSSSKEGK